MKKVGQKVDVVVTKRNKSNKHNKICNAPSLGEVAEELRDVTEHDYKLILKISKCQRKLDKKYKKLRDETDIIEKMRLFNNKEFKQSIKLSKSLRDADKEYVIADKIEEKSMQERKEEKMLDII